MATVAFLFGLSGRTELAGSTLRRLLADVGLSDDAARALLSRMRRRGQLAVERNGREATYRLAGSYARGFEYIRRQALGTIPPWDGAFHTVLYRVPEESRFFRDALRRAAVMSGYGVLQPGVLVAPHDYRDQLTATLANKPADSQVLFARLETDRSDAARVVAAAWRLDDVAEVYSSHIASLRGCLRQKALPQGPEGLRTYAETLAPALSATLYEPSIPADLLPAEWPGPTLRKLVVECSDRFGPSVTRYVATLM